MPALLDIPREVRDYIIELILSSSRTPPQSPSTASQKRIELHNVEYRSWGYGPSHNKYEQRDYVTTSLPLLLVNRQLFAETQSALKRLSTKHSYSLDVMLVNEQELWPTWLSVPALSNRVDSVVATFRIFGSWEGKYRSAFHAGNGAPPRIVWCFYSLMERFLKCGPVGERKPGSQDKDVAIKALILNIMTPLDIDMLAPQHVEYWDWFRSRDRFRARTDTDLSCSVMPPEWLADFLCCNILGLLSMGYHRADYGMIMYEWIGAMRVCVDGELKKEYDLSKMLADLRFDDPLLTFGSVWPREKRVPVFWK